MKFQIILESLNKKTAQMADDDFNELIRTLCRQLRGFKLVGTRSLEGIRAEAWEPAERDVLD